ncbi:MAG: amidohydrolase family protein [Bacteroidota bacterium]
MIKINTLLTWGKRLLVTALVLSVTSVLFVNRELEKMYGGMVKQIDISLHMQKAEKIIVIENVNVLSQRADSMLPNRTVHIREGIIDTIGESIPAPKESRIVNGTGKFLIPGLIDSHIHLWQSPNDLLLYLANGITTVRELKGSDHHLDWRAEITSGKRPGPNLFVASTKLQSKDFFAGAFLRWTQGDIIQTEPNEAIEVVKDLQTKGYDAVKIGSFLDEENYLAVNASAKELGMPVIGHFPLATRLDKLWTSNQTEVSHLEEFVKQLNREFGRVNSQNKEAFLKLVAQRAPQIAQKLVELDISVVTTLWLMESIPRQMGDIHDILEEVPLEYVNPGIAEGSFIAKGALGWLPEVNRYLTLSDEDETERAEDLAYFDTYVKANQLLLRLFHENGVTIMAGTDANVSAAVPGFSLHAELTSMNRCGMQPSDILRSATSIPAQRMNMNRGIVAKGFEADLVLLDQNPLEDISNTQSVTTVIRKDKIYDREDLNEMLTAVKEVNDQSRTQDISQYELKHEH